MMACTNNGIVYFIGNKKHDLVKIGLCRTQFNFPNRLQTLQTNCPFDVSLFFAILCFGEVKPQYVEKRLHRLFNPYRIKNEWFRLKPCNYCFLSFAKHDVPEITKENAIAYDNKTIFDCDFDELEQSLVGYQARTKDFGLTIREAA